MATDLNTTTQPLESSTVDFSASGAGFDLGGSGALSDDDNNNDGDHGAGGNLGGDGEDDDEEVGRSSIFGQFAAERQQQQQQNANGKASGEGVRVRSTATEGGRREKPKKRVVDLWAMLDPHEEVGAVKPFKKGKYNKLNKCIERKEY